MNFPLDFWDISLLTAVTAIILLITSEMLSPYYGKINVKINRKRLRISSLITTAIFLATAIIRIIGIILEV